MTLPPWLVLAALISLLLALLYQVATKRFGWRVLGYWLVSFLGLLAAEAASESLGLNITRYGDLRLLPDAVGALGTVCLFWLLGV